jgi:uncharacterized protein (TIGR02444 family)
MTTDSAADAECFWMEAAMHYEQPAVKAACLSLQQEHGLNINLLLLSWWLAERNIALLPAQFKTLINTTRLWHEQQLGAVRQLRNAASQAYWLDDDRRQALAQKLLDSELLMERIEQRMLLDQLANIAPQPQSDASALQNLWNYLFVAGVPYLDDLNAPLAAISNSD